jgi:hypothetical protein
MNYEITRGQNQLSISDVLGSGSKDAESEEPDLGKS